MHTQMSQNLSVRLVDDYSSMLRIISENAFKHTQVSKTICLVQNWTYNMYDVATNRMMYQ
mgnify:CR=1 FL=1